MLGTMRPAASRKVGAKALRLTSLLLTRPEALIPSGQRMAKGTRDRCPTVLTFQETAKPVRPSYQNAQSRYSNPEYHFSLQGDLEKF